MKIYLLWVQQYFDQPLPNIQTIADLLSLHTCEVEEVLGDAVLDCKILPDRAHYLLSHIGFAREIHTLTKIPLKNTVQKHVTPTYQVDSNIPVPNIKIETPLCSRYIATRVEHIQNTESQVNIKDFLTVVGQHTISLAVDISNVVMLDTGQPLHMFDADKIQGDIVVRLAKQDESIVILGGEEKKLTTDDVVIADDLGPLAIAGVKGGKRAEVTMSTKNIILEAAHFDPVAVRKTSVRLNLRNDSSKRFENEITPDLALGGAYKALQMLKESMPNVSISQSRDIYPNPVSKWSVVVNVHTIAHYIGVHEGGEITKEQIISILTSMECVVKAGADEHELIITPPLYRLDMQIEQDIVDEIVRILGYDKLVGTLPPQLDIHNTVPVDVIFYASEKTKNSTKKLGYSEAILYSLVAKGDREIAYPLASDKAFLRNTLAIKMKEALVKNSRNAEFLFLEHVKIIEIGNVFTVDGEYTSIAMGVQIIKKKKGISVESLLKADIASLEKDLGVSFDWKFEMGDFGIFATANFGEKAEAIAGNGTLELSQLSFDRLPQHTRFIPYSEYPFVIRDVAVFVPADVDENTVQKLIESARTELCVALRCFDRFTKEIDGVQKTSYAFRLIFQSFSRTLTEEEVDRIMQNIYAVFVDNGWVVR